MRKFVLILASIVLLIYAAAGIYEVEPEETAVSYVFGKIVNRHVPSGINWNFPPPIGRQVVHPTRLTQVLRIGYAEIEDEEVIGTDFRDLDDLWFTGGASVVEGRFDIQYSIDKLDRYLVSHDDPEAFMQLITERAVTRFLAGLHVDQVLTTERQALVQEISMALQNGLDEYDMGIQIQDISIVQLAPPLAGGVSNSFRRVQSARSERDREIENARSEATRIEFDAQAEAETLRSSAQADQFARVEKARAEAASFEALAKERALAPDVTRIRLYRDIIPEVLQKTKVIVVPSDSDSAVTVEER